MKINRSAADIVNGLHGKLAGVFFTHLHIDRIAGVPELPDDVQLFIGPSESSEHGLLNVFTQSPTNALLQGKPQFQEWKIRPDPDQQFEAVTDIFGDGTIFGISVPDHTSGSTAYLVRTTRRPVLLTGDASHTRWCWEHGVEPGQPVACPGIPHRLAARPVRAALLKPSGANPASAMKAARLPAMRPAAHRSPRSPSAWRSGSPAPDRIRARRAPPTPPGAPRLRR